MAETTGAVAGRVALVTGGAKRLGRAIAEALAEDGADVVVHYRTSGQEADDVVAHLVAAGAQAWKVQANLADAEDAAALLGRAREAAGRPIGILVNNAGIFSPSHVLEFSREELDAQVQVNAFAPLALCRALARQQCPARPPGPARPQGPAQVVNMLDTRMLEYDADHAAYHLSKRMLFSLTRMLALELAPRVRVNGIAPGLILPPPGKDTSYLEALSDTVPLNRYGSADDIVRAVRFLVHSDFVTGQVIYVDGGRHMLERVYGS